jgi:DNA-binding LytR/AlgR family response regulator
MKTSTIPAGKYINSRTHLNPVDILYLKGAINYTYVYLVNGDRVIVCTTLKILEERLRNLGFLRASRSFVINLDCVKTYKPVADRGKIEMLNNDIIEVSRRKNKMLKIFFDTKSEVSC